MLHRWINQFKEYGTCVDRRGKATKKEAPSYTTKLSSFFLRAGIIVVLPAPEVPVTINSGALL